MSTRELDVHKTKRTNRPQPGEAMMIEIIIENSTANSPLTPTNHGKSLKETTRNIFRKKETLATEPSLTGLRSDASTKGAKGKGKAFNTGTLNGGISPRAAKRNTSAVK